MGWNAHQLPELMTFRRMCLELYEKRCTIDEAAQRIDDYLRERQRSYTLDQMFENAAAQFANDIQKELFARGWQPYQLGYPSTFLKVCAALYRQDQTVY